MGRPLVCLDETTVKAAEVSRLCEAVVYASRYCQASVNRSAAFKTSHAFVNLHPNRRKKI